MFACTGPFTGGHAQAVWEEPYDQRPIGRMLITHLKFECAGVLISPLRRQLQPIVSRLRKETLFQRIGSSFHCPATCAGNEWQLLALAEYFQTAALGRSKSFGPAITKT